MRLLVANCNRSASMTNAIVAVAKKAARPGTEIIGAQPTWGVASAEGFYESFISAAAVLDLFSDLAHPVDAVVMAGFGEHGREGARQVLSVPVVDITEASVQLACLLGHRFGIVTSVRTAIAPITDSLLLAGLASRCVGIRACDIAVLNLHDDPDKAVAAIAEQGRTLRDQGADVLVLGCAGMGGELDRAVEEVLGLPVVEGVAAAVAVAEVLVHLGKSTSKVGPYARPSTSKPAPIWPGRLIAQPSIVAHE